MKAILTLADFIAAHPDKIKVQGAVIEINDAALQPRVQAMLDAVRTKNEAIVKAQQRLNAIAAGS
jgi:hypothetical protein